MYFLAKCYYILNIYSVVLVISLKMVMQMCIRGPANAHFFETYKLLIRSVRSGAANCRQLRHPILTTMSSEEDDEFPELANTHMEDAARQPKASNNQDNSSVPPSVSSPSSFIRSVNHGQDPGGMEEVSPISKFSFIPLVLVSLAHFALECYGYECPPAFTFVKTRARDEKLVEN